MYDWMMFRTDSLQITPPMLKLIASLDEFNAVWRTAGTLAPERLTALRRVATIESIGSSTRIEGSQLSDREIERLLSNLDITAFATRDEQKVAEHEQLVLAALPTLSLQIVEWVKAHGRITMLEAIRVTGSNRHTLKSHFRALVRNGHLARYGAGRGVWYAAGIPSPDGTYLNTGSSI